MNEGTMLTESELEELRRYAKAGAGSPVDFVGLARALDKALGHIDAMRAVPTDVALDVQRLRLILIEHGLEKELPGTAQALVTSLATAAARVPGLEEELALLKDCESGADAVAGEALAAQRTAASERDALQARVAELERNLAVSVAETGQAVAERDTWMERCRTARQQRDTHLDARVAAHTRATAAEAKVKELEEKLNALECVEQDEEAAHAETLDLLTAQPTPAPGLREAVGKVLRGLPSTPAMVARKALVKAVEQARDELHAAYEGATTTSAKP